MVHPHGAPAVPSPSDALLAAFVAAPEPQAQALLGRLLVEHAVPIVDQVLGARLAAGGGGSGEGQPARSDLRSQALLYLLRRLRALRAGGDASAIEDFSGYVARVARNTFFEHLRRRHSGRDGQGAAAETGAAIEEIPDPHPDAAAQWDLRSSLAALWREVVALPPRQAAALLLSLRDEKGKTALFLFPLTGTVTMRQIATVLRLSAERFAELWNRLPLDDLAIAGLLGLKRQQVINLRQAARKRLGRRLRRRGLGL